MPADLGTISSHLPALNLFIKPEREKLKAMPNNICKLCGAVDIGDHKKVKLSDGRIVNLCGMCRTGDNEGVIGMPDDPTQLGLRGGLHKN